MTKRPADFAERNTERAIQATNYGMDWLREVAEQNLDHSKASVEALVIATRKAVDALDQQTSLSSDGLCRLRKRLCRIRSTFFTSWSV
jgi:hypothetical protein